MALNPFFLQGSGSEQFLVQDLINEQLRMYGIEVYYLPRKFISVDNILNDVETSKFDDNFIIEAYLDNYEGYAPGSDVMSKFGLRLKNEINLVISRERFEEFIAPFLIGIESQTGSDMLLNTRPREGDLIFFPLGKRLFEIKRVEHEKPFYQLGKNYVFEIQCELFEYENEVIDTDVVDIDQSVQEEGYITTLNFVGAGITATANAQIGDGILRKLILTDDGSGYTSTPTVAISSSPTGNTADNATAVAITTSVGNVKSIKELLITFGGRGYTSAPTVTIIGGGGSGAAATSMIGDGGVNNIVVTNMGDEYYSEPVITVSDPTGPGLTTAIVTAIVGTSGTITSINIVDAGVGYTSTPTVTIAPPIVSVGGTFVYNEIVTGSNSKATAYVRDFDGNLTLRVGINTGQFRSGETIVGSASSASYILKSYDNYSYEEEYDKNEEFEVEADNILDFTESNPFGEI